MDTTRWYAPDCLWTLLLPKTVEEEDRKEWVDEMAFLVDWFMQTELPTEPLRLSPAEFVLNPSMLYDNMREGCGRGPIARCTDEALERHLEKLYELFG